MKANRMVTWTAWIALTGSPVLAGAQVWTPPGKQITDRSIVTSVVVEATPERVYDLWTTREGIKTFFGVDAEIDEAAGKYEIFFLPRAHEESAANSTMGAELLRALPNEFLAFEWSTRPVAPHLDEHGMRLWVEIELTSLDARRTIVDLRAHGFGEGAEWGAVFDFDSRSWNQILFALDRVVVDPEYRPLWVSIGS